MSSPTTIDELFALYEAKGAEEYGERITQLEHGLQCAALAVQAGAPDALVAAALFHDVGHLVADLQGTERFDLAVDDDDHEAIGARVLSPIFGPTVAQPVALHVTAKRWRCTVEPSYHDTLSEASKATLQAQGGLLDPEACERFARHPGHDDAVLLRSFDDEGKVVGWEVPAMDHYEPMLRQLAAQHHSH